MRVDERAREAAAMRASGKRVGEIAAHFDVTWTTVYRWLDAHTLTTRIAELEAALDDLHMHASPGASGWIMVPYTEWVQVFKRVGFPKIKQN